MFKDLGRKLVLGALSWVLLLTTLVSFPGDAHADKVAKAVSLVPATEAVNVVAVYETTPMTQKEVASSLLKTSKSLVSKATGFDSFAVFQSEDGARVMTLTQWKDAASYEAFSTQPTEASSSKKEKVTAEPIHTVAYTVDQAQVPAGMTPAIRGKRALVQFGEVTADPPEALDQLLASAEAALPGAAQLYPSPHTAVLLKGVDTPSLAVLASWGSADEFEDVTVLPTLSLLPEDIAVDQHLYEAVKVIAAKPAKEKEEEAED